MKNLYFAVLCGLLTIFAVSCNKEKIVAVTSVSLSQSTAEMIVGETVQLSATVLPSDATDKSVTWASSKQSVATVTSSGKVTAVAEGVSTITASAGGKSANCTVTVSKGYVAVTSVTLNKTELALEKGKTETLTATVAPDDATDKTVIWNSSASSIATVDSNGKVTAVSGGNAVITAKVGDKQATCTVTVTVHVESITLDRESVTLEEESSITLVATVKPDDATDKTVTWSSSNNEIAAVDETGKVTAINEGEATITAKAEEKTATCKVTVNKKFIAVTSVTLNKAELALEKGQSETLLATVAPEDATDKNVTWTTSDEKVATVDNAGKVTAIAGGSAIITAKAGEKEATCAVTVTVPVTSVSLDQNSLSLEEEQTATLTATVLPGDATDKTVTWSSSNDAVAKVENGVVTAIKEGTVTITATAGGKEAKCEVTVKKNHQNEPIKFADAKAKEKLVAAFDTNHDGELSYGEAVAVSTIDGAFGDTKGIKSFDEFQYFTSVKTVPDQMFKDWAILESITLPQSITEIGWYAFQGCSKLREIVIPDGVKTLPAYCFEYCYDLVSVRLPKYLEVLGGLVFSRCTSLTYFELPNTLRTIGEYAFTRCAELVLSSERLPDGLQTIGDGAFSECKKITSLIIPDSVTKIGYSAFKNSGLQNIKLPEDLEIIELATFEGCTGLKSIKIPETVFKIGNSAFAFSGLKQITLPDLVSEIDYTTFSGCRELESVVLPKNLTNIGSRAFGSCEKLSTLSIPESVTKIGAGAFNYCTGIKALYIKATTPPTIYNTDYISSDPILYRASECPIYVPAGTANAYKAASGWGIYADRIREIQD